MNLDTEIELFLRFFFLLSFSFIVAKKLSTCIMY